MRGARGTGSDRARALATVCETVDAAEFSVDHLGESKRIPPVPELLQRGYLRGVTHSGGHEAIQRGLRAIVAAREPGAAPDLAHELHRGLKEIHHQPELVAIELIDGVQGWRRVIAVPPQQFADVGPYLLLNMRIVVFLVRAPAGELDLAPLTVAEKMVIDELRAVVG